ncbi:hypothetical protein CYMTET_3487 [Cymbomonas tetramitiformis]|uniref:Ubiquitin-like protease family profile domain-containing protein n=1 Tax=Cymbomonas tetramitiformis TaxID=36881 RepID=A0AAE0H372_9CHLO|nr:hypothetical protein CYMTET_3487 [Cymbomonas tetramitiformis]
MNRGDAVSRAAPTVHATSAANEPPDDEGKLQVPPPLAHVVSDGPGPYTQVARQVVDMLIDQGELPPAPAAVDAATNARHASAAFDVRLEPVLPFVECGPGSCTQLARRGVAMLLDQGTVSLAAPTVDPASAAYELPDDEGQLQVLPPLAHVVSDGPGPYSQAARQVVDMLIEQGELPPAPAAVNAATNTAIDAPQQNNGIDCGVYMLLNATFISKGEALDYTTADITAARSKISERILRHREELSTERHLRMTGRGLAGKRRCSLTASSPSIYTPSTLRRSSRNRRQRARRFNPGVNEQRAQDDRVRRSQPGVLEAKAQRERDRCSQPGVLEAKAQRERDRCSQPGVLEAKAQRERDRCSHPRVQRQSNVDETGAPNPGVFGRRSSTCTRPALPTRGLWKAKLKVHGKNVNIIGEKNADDRCD